MAGGRWKHTSTRGCHGRLFVALLCLCPIARGEGGSRQITAELFLNNGVDYGEWGDQDFCPDGSFAHAFEVKFEAFSSTDETAVNGVKLYCSTPAGHDTGYSMSTEGRYGQWMGMRICGSGFLTAMRANVLQPQGVMHDDVAIENLELECNYGDEVMQGVEEAKFQLGEWSRWAHCYTGSALCGLQVRYEAPYIGDDSATTDLIMYCCEVTARGQEVTAMGQGVTARGQEVTARGQEVTARGQEVTARGQGVTDRGQGV